ncbi:selenium-binding protein SBP56-related protein [Bythopirellula goksoeyrii]|uniref:Methanethiol oxidase n=1 Tax=Bythopirellula goksoeyrii TaxID=1400387 RepID=A0A5B9Q916_9BACT|nr:selenium-binding protein SBP56-related protein [Bythopirellula goksoeyrii]QEG35487.1 56kDa selenium binding protein (SBP56) [Bythopirellula goksoeyrii]
MKRREFLETLAATGLVASTSMSRLVSQETHQHLEGGAAYCHPTYATVADAIASPPERFAFVSAIFTGTLSDKPDYMATVDLDPKSPTYSKVVGRLQMPTPGDELHHYGWNACSSCHGQGHRRYLIVPGLASGNIHVVDAINPAELKLQKTISGKMIATEYDLSTPHTVHCLSDGSVVISMLGNGAGEAPGGFLELDAELNIVGPWQKSLEGMNFNYDYWYQPRHNVMVSSEWAAPNTVSQGFSLEDVKAGKYGQHLQFWNWKERKIEQTVDLGSGGLIPLEVRFYHNPDSTHGFVGAALSSAIFHWHKNGDRWQADKVVQVDPVETEGWPFPVPGLITDLVLSMDDRFLYLSNWLHGDIRQYDVSDPANPKLTGQVWLGGVIGHPSNTDRNLTGGPQMLQLSLDGKRLYVTSSLYSVWDNQFYPKIAEEGSWMMRLDCDTGSGGLKLNREFFVNFGKEPWGPVRAHEIRFPGGDSTSDIWV